MHSFINETETNMTKALGRNYCKMKSIVDGEELLR